MFYPKSTYKKLFTYLFLGIYLACTLSVPVFEGVHFLLHLGDKAQIHSFQTHQSTHQHDFLNLLDGLMNEIGSDTLPVDSSQKIKVKKLVQISDSFVSKEWIFIVINSSTFRVPRSFYQSPYAPIFFPPPEV